MSQSGEPTRLPELRLPERPSLEQLRKQAKELLRQARAGAADAVARLATADPLLADAQRVVARRYGFPSWPALVHHVEAIAGDAPGSGSGPFRLRPLIRPVEFRDDARLVTLPDGGMASAATVFETFVAARDGDLGRVQALLARHPGLATVEYNYTPPIHFAVREGHHALTELLLDRGADLAYRSYPFQDSLLEMAEDREHADIARLLRERLARRFALADRVAAVDALILAAQGGDVATVQAALARDPGLAALGNATGDTALHHAAQRGHLDVVHLLLDAGAHPDVERGDGYRPVHGALMRNWVVGAPSESGRAIARLLLTRGARYTVLIAALLGDHAFVGDAVRRDRSLANAEDSCHHRPISAAARRNDLALARLLLEHGAEPNAREEGAPRGHALWSAVYERHREMAALLLAHGADPNAMVESSGTPMLMARADPELRALLRAHGGIEEEETSPRARLAQLIGDGDLAGVERMVRASPALALDDEGSWGEGVLAGPAHAGNHEMIALLLRLGARVPPVSKWAPAYYLKHEATAAFLLANGMDANHMSWHRLTLLHHMAATGELGKARLLVDHGAAIDAIDDEYRSTPLGMAARRGQQALVAFLLERGADPNTSGATWSTPLAWATKRGHDEVAAMLRAAGAN